MTFKKSAAWALGALLGIVGIASAAIVYSGYIVNNPVLAYGQRVVFDTRNAGTAGRSVTSLAATSYISSATVPTVQFGDGVASTGTITPTSISGLVAVAATNQITVVSTSSLKNASIYVNGKKLRQGYDWKVKATVNLTATDIARVVNLIAGVHASAGTNGVVYATATVAGTAANSITLAVQSANSQLTVAHATFTGGVDNAYFTVGSKTFTQGTEWSVGGSTQTTANNMAAAIVADSATNALVSVSTATGPLRLTAKAVGTAGNLALATFPSSITKSGTVMTGGTDLAWTLNSATIHKTSHGFGTGLSVLYSTGAVAIGGLTNQTTYYVSVVDADNFKLATSTTNAVAGTGIPLTSTTTLGGHTYSLAPIAISGTYGFRWQTSDDNITWTDIPLSVSVSSVSFASPYTAASNSWNFGVIGHRYIGVYFDVGSRGAVNVQIAGTGQD